MLEQATACIEPAAHHLLKRLEVPTRSKRVLLQSFWRNGADDLARTVWWPEYLHDVRRSSQARLCAQREAFRDIGSSGLSSLEGAGQYLGISLPRNLVQLARLAVEFQPRVDGSRQDRSYSRSHGRFGQPIRQPIRQPETVKVEKKYSKGAYGSPQVPSPDIPPHIRGRSTMTQARTESLRPSFPASTTESLRCQTLQSPGSRPIYANPEELHSLLQKRQDAFDEAWRLFVALGTPEIFVRRMLQYLSKSKRRIDHERAVRAYKLLPADRRTERIYAHAMKVANLLRSQRLALEINHEALAGSLGGESSRIFFAYLVRNNLWNTLAQTLDDFREIWRNHRSRFADPDKQNMMSSDLRDEKANSLSNQVWADVDEMTRLPEKVLSLIRRIQTASPFSPLKEPRVQRLAKDLLYRVVQSPRIMAIITGTGFLSLFQQSAKIQVLAPNHYYQAIRTLLAMAQSRNRSSLAALAYRNLRFRFKETQIPRWIYGSLISIFTNANQPSHSMRFLLDEFASMHGRPDQRAYQKVMVACARLGDVEGVYHVFKQFSDDYGIPRDLGYITPLLYVHARLGDVTGTQAQFDRLTTNFNVKPDTYCWNILLASHARAKDSRGAFKAFRDMQRLGVKPDAYSFGTLMGICSSEGNTEAVHKLVDLAREENITGTTAMVDTLVHSYCLNDEPESAKDLVEAATNMNLEGSPTRVWNTLLRHYAFKADSEAVLKVQERMRKMSIKPDGMTYAALMTALVVIGKTEDAAKILRSLHFSEHLTATLFHYSIVLHGFAMEGNRDMVSVIYNEILEHFPRPSASARLAVLHSQTRRDKSMWQTRQMRIAPASKMLHLPRALDFLVDSLLETAPADLASKDPQPGFQRMSSNEALPSIYMEFLISTLNSAGAFHKAEKLLARCQSLIDTSYLSFTERTKANIQLLMTHMIGCIRKGEFARADRCWNLILQQALPHGRPLLASQDPDSEDPFVATVPPRSPSRLDINLPHAKKNFNSPTNFTSGSEWDDLKILPSYRYLLAVPLTHYMQALSAQNLVSLVPALVEKLENAGFALTSKNYNTYIQVLTQSADPQRQLDAFKIFEEKLLPNMPPWPILRRGKWIPRSISKQNDQGRKKNPELDPETGGQLDPESEPEPEPVPRRLIEKFRPGLLVPTYYTMVFLASAFMRFQRRGARGENMNIRQLRMHAPGTVEAVLQLPYLQDRVQGVLLRGREIRGDLVKRPRRPPKPDRAGVRGSKSLLDHIPIDHAYKNPLLEFALDDKTPIAESTPPNISDAQMYTGEIFRQPAVMERTGRLEFDSEFRSRVRREGQAKLAVVEQMRADAKKERIVSDIYFGEPHIASINFKTKDHGFRKEPVQKPVTSSKMQSVLLNEARERIERMWEAQRDGKANYPVLPSTRLRIGKRRYPRKGRLALDRSKIPPNPFEGVRPTHLQRLTLFKPPAPLTLRQSRAFKLNKRAMRRRKRLRQREIAEYNRLRVLLRKQNKDEKHKLSASN
jgi:pentatricopeptide repeat-containing protein PET309